MSVHDHRSPVTETGWITALWLGNTVVPATSKLYITGRGMLSEPTAIIRHSPMTSSNQNLILSYFLFSFYASAQLKMESTFYLMATNITESSTNY